MLKKIVLLVLISGFLSSCKEEKKEVSPKIKLLKEKEVKKNDFGKMVFFEGGTIQIGANDRELNERPSFEMEILPFYLDKNLVTIDEFRKFIQEAGYQTEADTFGDSLVFLFETGNWVLLKGANWEYPLGVTEAKGIGNHPVTHVSWNDARAYAKWIGKRLPTEFEWEYAAKGGESTSTKYAWGSSIEVNKKYKANVWQGVSVSDRLFLDGYKLTSPVGVFGETPSGLTDMGGNVWQWCENSYESYPSNLNRGNKDSKVRSTRGGSFMFDAALENSYTTTFRGKNSVETSLFNAGFRCAKSN